MGLTPLLKPAAFWATFCIFSRSPTSFVFTEDVPYRSAYRRNKTNQVLISVAGAIDLRLLALPWAVTATAGDLERQIYKQTPHLCSRWGPRNREFSLLGRNERFDVARCTMPATCSHYTYLHCMHLKEDGQAANEHELIYRLPASLSKCRCSS